MFFGGLVTFEDVQQMLKPPPLMSYNDQVYRAFFGMIMIAYKLHRLRQSSPVMYGVAKAFCDSYPEKTVADLFTLPKKPPTLEESLQSIIDYWLAQPDVPKTT